ncbi:hypothetical protein A2U01_0103267, partial [Trifolium medium]|nr:hypothetical protein [Trifolium medium]
MQASQIPNASFIEHLVSWSKLGLGCVRPLVGCRLSAIASISFK